jgi:hypothetical protein
LKKLAALLLTMMFVMGLAAYAFAEVAITGDARVRGIYTNNFDATDTVPDTGGANDDHSRYYDERVRLNIDGKNDDEAAVKIQVTVVDGYLDGNSSSPDPVAGDVVGMTRAENYAYILVPFGDVKVEAGLMPADWGNKFMAWGAAKQRIKVYTKMGDMTVGAFTQKTVESGMAQDRDAYSAYAVTPVGDLKVGAIAIYDKKSNDGAAADATGTTFDAFVNGKMGDMGLVGELCYKTGDTNKTLDKDGGENSPMGFFVHADMQMDALNVGGAVAMTKNGYVANKYFTPTAFFGTSQPTGLADFGQSPGGNADTTAFVVAVSSKISDSMSAGVKVAYAQMKEYAALMDTMKITEVDATFTYNIGKDTKYEAVLAYGKPTNFSVEDDPITAATHGLYVSF